MGQLKYLMLHNSATPENREVTKEDIEKWHLKERGWSKVGYSKLFQRVGSVIDFYEIDSDQWITSGELTNGAVGFNSISVHWCIAGGLTRDKKEIFGSPENIINQNQLIALKNELTEFVKYHPQVKIIGHNQVSHKSCPGFKVSSLLKQIGFNQYIEDKIFI